MYICGYSHGGGPCSGAGGRCVEVPSSGPDRAVPPKAHLNVVNVIERYGLVWLCPGEPAVELVREVERPHALRVERLEAVHRIERAVLGAERVVGLDAEDDRELVGRRAASVRPNSSVHGAYVWNS